MIGEKVSHYRILDELGRGGMGILYRAEDTRLGRIVALKFLSPELTRNERARERLINEARAASVLDHPNICTIHEIEETADGRVFLVLACYEGETARDRLERGCMPLDEAVGVALHVARGLANAHGNDIVHRDIKPANVFITKDGIAKILDFGLARHVGQTRITRVGSTVGTVAYMSPEQARGEEVDEKSDVWSLGALMYECLTGELPFKGGHPQTVLHSIINNRPAPVAQLREDVPSELASTVMRCLDKKPGRRPTAEDVVRSLQSQPHGSSADPRAIRARTTTLVTAARRTPRTGLVATAVLASFLALVATPVGRGAMQTLFRQDSLPTRKLLAVLPFTANGEEDVFARGFGQYLTLKLSQMEKLDADFRVVPPFEISRGDIDTPERALAMSGATLAAIGNVSRTGDVFSMRIDLVETQSGRTLRTWRQDESAANVSALQRDAALSLSELLGVETSDDTKSMIDAGATTLPRAFEAYVRGLGTLAGTEPDKADTTGGAQDRVSEAIALFERAVTRDPAYTLAHAALGRAWLEDGDAGDGGGFLYRAAAECSLAISLEDHLSSPHVTLARVYRVRGKYDEARIELRRALDIDPLDLDARCELAQVGIDSDEEDKFAEEVYLEAVRLRSSYWWCYYKLAIFYHDTGRDSLAVEWLKRASEVAPGNPDVYSALSAIYFYAGLGEEAMRMSERSIDAEPSWEGYNNLGTLHFTESEYADAIRNYKKALACDGPGYEVWGNLAAAYEWTSDDRDSVDLFYRRAAELCEPVYTSRPNDPHVVINLASYYAEIGTPEDALELVRRATEIAPEDAYVALHAGHTYEVLGERDMALRWIERALAFGYSREEIEDTPALRELCTDARYRSLVQRGSNNEGT